MFIYGQNFFYHAPANTATLFINILPDPHISSPLQAQGKEDYDSLSKQTNSQPFLSIPTVHH
jgi:hypothetical protein